MNKRIIKKIGFGDILEDNGLISRFEMTERTWCMDKSIVSGLFLHWNNSTGL